MSEMLEDSLMRSTQRIVLEWKKFRFEVFERMIKQNFPLINDSARNKTKRPLPCRPIKFRDVETPVIAKHSADCSEVENVQI